MYTEFALIPEAGAPLPFATIRSRLRELPTVVEDPRKPATNYLFCQTPDHANSLRNLLAGNEDLELPPVGVVAFKDNMVLIFQETTRDVRHALKEFVQWILSQVSCTIEDLEGNLLVSSNSQQLDSLFD